MSANMPWTTHYESGVRPSIDIPSVPLTQILLDSARKYPENVAIEFNQHQINFEKLIQIIYRLANGLLDIGFKKNDRIALLLPNVPHFVFSYFAALKIGAVVVPINFLFSKDYIANVLKETDPKAIIVWEGFLKHIKNIIFLHIYHKYR